MRTGLYPLIIHIRDLSFVTRLPISAETEISCRSVNGGSAFVIRTPLIAWPSCRLSDQWPLLQTSWHVRSVWHCLVIVCLQCRWSGQPSVVQYTVVGNRNACRQLHIDDDGILLLSRRRPLSTVSPAASCGKCFLLISAAYAYMENSQSSCTYIIR